MSYCERDRGQPADAHRGAEREAEKELEEALGMGAFRYTKEELQELCDLYSSDEFSYSKVAQLRESINGGAGRRQHGDAAVGHVPCSPDCARRAFDGVGGQGCNAQG